MKTAATFQASRRHIHRCDKLQWRSNAYQGFPVCPNLLLKNMEDWKYEDYLIHLKQKFQYSLELTLAPNLVHFRPFRRLSLFWGVLVGFLGFRRILVLRFLCFFPKPVSFSDGFRYRLALFPTAGAMRFMI